MSSEGHWKLAELLCSEICNQQHEAQLETSSVPHGLILWPTRSNIFINGLHNGTEHNFSKFADNTKLGELVDKLYGWTAPGGTSPPSQGRQSFFSALWWGTSAVLGSVLGFPLRERPGHTGVSSGKHQEMSKGLMQVGSERAGGVHPGKDKAQEYLIFMCKIFDGRQ